MGGGGEGDAAANGVCGCRESNGKELFGAEREVPDGNLSAECNSGCLNLNQAQPEYQSSGYFFRWAFPYCSLL